MTTTHERTPFRAGARSQSIRVRLTILIVVSSTLLFATFALVVRYVAAMHFEELDGAELEGKVAVARLIVREIQSEGDLADAQRRLATALVGHAGVTVRVSRDDGSVLLSVEDEAAGGRGSTTRTRVRTERIDHAVLGNVRLEATLDVRRHHAFMSELLALLVTAVGAGAALAGLVGWIVAGRALRPIRHLTVLAKAVSAESLGRRIGTASVPEELRELALSFDAMLDRLQQSFARLADYSVDLAHELRTPLNNLITQTEVALSRPRDADEYREVLYAALEQCRRLARMINDMLFIARAEKGLLVPRRSAVDVEATVTKVLEYFQPLAADRAVTLAQRGRGTIVGDALMLERAIANLVSNAIRHAVAETRIDVTIDVSADATVIAVTNRGETIPPERLARLFERFYRADAGPRAGEGSGLGLAITKSIAEAHAGTVSVHSGDGLTRFELRIPREGPDAGRRAFEPARMPG